MLSVKKDHYAHVPIYRGEKTEEELADYHTYPPMTVWGDSLKYVFATGMSKVLPMMRPSQEQVDEIYRRLVDYAKVHCANDVELEDDLRGIREVWAKVATGIKANRGLYDYMDDYGAESRSFFRFLDLVPHAIALESAFGVNYDNAGNYHELAPGCISRKCAVSEPIFVDLRRRGHHSGLLAHWVYNYHPEDYLVTLGCGLMLELRKFGVFTLEQIRKMHIIACDADPDVRKHLDVVFRHDFGVPFEATGIEFRQCNIEEVLHDERLYDRVAAILLDGVASYLDESTLLNYLLRMKRMLRPYGRIACDLQVMECSLIRCATALLWKSDMHPELTVNWAVKKMLDLSRRAGLDCQYEIDPRNPRPVGVYYYLGDGIGSEFSLPL